MVESRKEQRNLANGHVNEYNHGDQQAQQEQEKVMKHLTTAFNHWKALSEKQKQESWRLEILRAYAREQEKHKGTAARLEKAEQEVLHLRAQVDRLSKCQQPREFLLFPPSTVPIAHEAVQELSRVGLDSAALDYDRLVDKWKSVIQRNRKSSSGMPAQKPLPNTPRNRNFSTPHSTVGMVNGHSALQSAHVDDLDEDLDDADGEGDDQDHDAPPPGRAPQAVMDRGVLDPSLQNHTDGMVLDGIEGNGGMDPEGFIHGQMLMGLSAREFGASMNGDKEAD